MTDNSEERKPLLHNTRTSPQDTNSNHSPHGFYESNQSSEFREIAKSGPFLEYYDPAFAGGHSVPHTDYDTDTSPCNRNSYDQVHQKPVTPSSLSVESDDSDTIPSCVSLEPRYADNYDHRSLRHRNGQFTDIYGSTQYSSNEGENNLENKRSLHEELGDCDNNINITNVNSSTPGFLIKARDYDVRGIPSLSNEPTNSARTFDNGLASSLVADKFSALEGNTTPHCPKTLASTSTVKPNSQPPIAPVVGSISESPKEEKEAGVQKWPFFLINVSLLFINCAGRFHSLVMDQYMYQESARTLLGNASVKTSSQPCLNESTANSSMTSLVSHVESLTSQRLLHLDLTSYGAGIISNVILGSYSTVLSRKVQLLIPTFGYFVRNVTVPVVIHWGLDINWLFLGYGFDGLCGNASGIYFGSYLYTTDVTPRNRKRTLGMAILMAGKGTVTAILNVATGHLIESTGFFIPSTISAACVLSSMLIVLVLPNRKPQALLGLEKTQSKWSLSRGLATLTQPFKKGHDGRVRQMVVLGCLAFLVTLTSHFGIAKIRVLFLMNLPFCWKASVIGWFLFGREFACRTFVVIAVAAFHKCLPGVTLGILGALSYLGGMIMYIFANMNYDLYCVPAIAIGQSLPLALIRGELSRMLDSKLQGPLFASFAVLESVSYAVGSLYLLVYKASLVFFPRLVFAIGAGMSAMVVIWMIWFQVLWRRHAKNQFSYNIVVDTPTGNGTSSSAQPDNSKSINS